MNSVCVCVCVCVQDMCLGHISYLQTTELMAVLNIFIIEWWGVIDCSGQIATGQKSAIVSLEVIFSDVFVFLFMEIIIHKKT